MDGLALAALFFFGLWGGSALWLLRHTQFSGWAKYAHVIAAFPLLLLLVIFNVVLTGRIPPELLELVSELEAKGWSSKLIAPVAFVAAAPVAGAVFFLWIWLLKLADRRFGAGSS